MGKSCYALRLNWCKKRVRRDRIVFGSGSALGAVGMLHLITNSH